MRRKDREVKDIDKINMIIKNAHCCRVGFYDDGDIYIVPLNFGYDEKNRIFYFHSAKEGRKIALMSKCHEVGFELDINYQLVEGNTACQYSAHFQSIIGNGRISIVENNREKEKGLKCIMEHITHKNDFDFNELMFNSVCVFKLEVNELSCKEHL